MKDSNFFINRELNESLNLNGFVKVPFFNGEELNLMRDFYSQMHQQSPGGYFDGIHMTTWSDDEEHKEKVKEGLRIVFEEPCEKLFQNYRALNHVFILKDSGTATEFNVHQDWSVVDETKYSSLNVWAPLYDVNANNGSLWILPGSHNIEEPIRGAGCIFPNYRQQIEEMREDLEPIDVKAGEALVFFHSTIHGSPPNLSGERRVVAVNSIVPKEAPLRIHFQKTPSSNLEVYEPSDDFVYEYENIREQSMTQPPKGKLVERKEPITVKNRF